MKNSHIILILLFLCFSIKAKDHINERVYVYTDKECYVTGEDIWIKFSVINQNFKPSTFSKVGYIEICDTERPQIQLKLALENGSGVGKIKIPDNIPSGIYHLYAYTRYMRDEGESVFFKQQLSIVNMTQPANQKRMKLIGKNETQIASPVNEQITIKTTSEDSNVLITTDKKEYINRDIVSVHFDSFPENIIDFVISVSRCDSLTPVGKTSVNKQEWLKQVTDTSSSFSGKWTPEYEGHIITGKIIADVMTNNLLSNIAFIGKDICYINGQINPDNKNIYFYTNGIYGTQEIVSSVVSEMNEAIPARIDIISPFSEHLPDSLPLLQIYSNEKQLMERYIGAQLQKNIELDSLQKTTTSENYYNLQPVLSYDLDQYTRFSTLSETILEFVNWMKITKVDGKRKIKVFIDEANRYNAGNTLVLLDGIPIYDHEDMLQYNPQYIKKIDIYSGRYVFGGIPYECIVLFSTHEGNLPFFRLGEESQLFIYECPSLPLKFISPDYATNLVKNSRKPDFRHTLYWDPYMIPTPGEPAQFSFYTSDLCGDFEIKIEGITTDGKIIYGLSHFQVKEHNK